FRPRGDSPTPVSIQHRDIKPQNILLMGGGVKVADFSLVTPLEDSFVELSFVGTVPYAAPEVFQRKVGRWSDQYSLAVTYCHLRGGRLPYDGSPFDILQGHLSGRPDLGML